MLIVIILRSIFSIIEIIAVEDRRLLEEDHDRDKGKSLAIFRLLKLFGFVDLILFGYLIYYLRKLLNSLKTKPESTQQPEGTEL